MPELLKRITTTNISDVWEAKLRGKKVVIKKPVEKDMIKILRFIREAKYWKEISDLKIHGVARVIEINEREPWFAVEYVEGEILTEYLRRNEPREIANRMLEVLRILEVVHSKGYLHLDIKPSNIMVDKYGDIVLLDWGLAAKIFRKLKDDKYKFIGTPYYAPPELRDPEKYGTPDVRSDIYEVAATFYRILTKQVPFASEKDMENGFLRTFPSSIPERLKNIIVRAMQPSMEMRYKSVREMYDDIKSWLRDEKIIMEGIHKTQYKRTLQILKNHGISFLPDSQRMKRNAICMINNLRVDMNDGVYIDFGMKKRFKTKRIYHGAYLYHEGRRIGQIDAGYRNLLIVDFPWKKIEMAKKYFELLKFLKDYGATIIFKEGGGCLNLAATRVLLKSEYPDCEIDVILRIGPRRIHLRLKPEEGIDCDMAPSPDRSAAGIFFDVVGCDV